MKNEKRKSLVEKLVLALLVLTAAVYTAALLRIVLFKNGFISQPRQLQLIPLDFVRGMFEQNVSLDVMLKNILGNIAAFVPLGVLLPVLFRMDLRKTVLAGVLTSLGFELIQLALGIGVADVDDIILNTLGTLAGAGLYFACTPRMKTLHRRLAALCFLAVFGLACVGAIWLYHPGMLPAQVEYENAELLNGTDRYSYDISAVCMDMDEGRILLREGSVSPREPAEIQAVSVEYPVDEDTLTIMEYRHFTYSPNGNIQKTTVTYRRASPEDIAVEAGSSGGGFIDIWLKDGGCAMLIYTVMDKSADE